MIMTVEIRRYTTPPARRKQFDRQCKAISWQKEMLPPSEHTEPLHRAPTSVLCAAFNAESRWDMTPLMADVNRPFGQLL